MYNGNYAQIITIKFYFDLVRFFVGMEKGLFFISIKFAFDKVSFISDGNIGANGAR